MSEANTLKGNTTFRNALVVMLGCFPAAAITIPSAANFLWYFFGLLGLVCCGTRKNPFSGGFSTFKVLVLVVVTFVLWGFLVSFFMDWSRFGKSRLDRELMILLAIPFLFLLHSVRIREEDFFRAMTLSAFLLFLYFVFWLIVDGEGRLDGVVHAIHFGNVALLILVACFLWMLFLFRRNGQLFILPLMGVVCSFVVFAYSGSRGGVLGLVGLLFVSALVFLPLTFRSLVAGVVVVTVSLAIIFSIPAMSKRLHDTWSEIEQIRKGDMNTSIGLRFQMWEVAVDVIKEAPLVGGGFSGYRNEVMARLERREAPETMKEFLTEPHNQYLYQAAAKGLIGLFLYLVLLVTPSIMLVRASLRHPGSVAGYVGAALFSVFVLYAFYGLTITLFDERRVTNIFAFFLALSFYYLCRWQEAERSPGDNGG